jgi:hypothetical protein
MSSARQVSDAGEICDSLEDHEPSSPTVYVAGVDKATLPLVSAVSQCDARAVIVWFIFRVVSNLEKLTRVMISTWDMPCHTIINILVRIHV